MIEGIKIASKGQKCCCCWNELTEADRKPGSSYAQVKISSRTLGESYSLTLFFCQTCAKEAVLACQAKIGTQIINDAVEGSIRTLVRLAPDMVEILNHESVKK